MTLRLRNKSFSYDFQIKGQRYYGAIGKVSRQTAQRIEAKLKADAIAGYFKMPVAKHIPTVAEALDTYLTSYRHSHRPKSTLRMTYLFPHLKARWGHLPLDALTPDVIRRYISERQEKVHSATYINNDLAAIKTVCTAHDHLMPNPFKPSPHHKPVAFLPKAPDRVRILTAEEEARLWPCLTPPMQMMVKLALYTGMRYGTLLDLRWGDIDLTEGRVFIPAERMKGKSPFAAPLHTVAIEVLRDLSRRSHLPGDQILLNEAGEPYKDPAHNWRRAVKKAGIKNFRFHDLRHTYASRLILAGVGIEAVQELLGHSSILMTRRYAHLTERHLREALERLSPAYFVHSADQSSTE